VYLSGVLGADPALTFTDALTYLLQQGSPTAHQIALAFQSHLRFARLSSASINRHLATLRSVAQFAGMCGVTTWRLQVPGIKVEKVRETRGPTADDVRRMLAAVDRDTEADTRDAAILVMFYCLGLRVSELCGLNFEDTDLSRGITLIRGKGRRTRESVPLPTPGAEAIRKYLKHRGSEPGPLFRSRGRRRKTCGRRLDTRSVLRIVNRLGQRIGRHVWCHALRHSSITQAAELGPRAGLGLDKIQAHSRHHSIATLMIYVDAQNRRGNQRTVAELLARTLRTSK
jgi:integrase/recombinase XerC